MPEAQQPLNLRSDVSLKNIRDIFKDPERSYDIVRAYDFNGWYEPASTEISGSLIYLTTNSLIGNNIILEVDAGRKIYECNYA